MSLAPFPVQPHFSGVSIAFKNPAYIADNVLPRIKVSKQDFRYLKWNLAEGFTIPETRVGRKGQPTEVEFSAVEQGGITNDYALDDPIPQNDINNQDEGIDVVSRAVERLTNIILLDREKRVSSLLFNLNTYPSANRVTLSGTDQWSDYEESDPIADIMTGMDKLVLRPNTMVIGRSAFTKLSMHPKIIRTYFGNNSDVGMVTRQHIASLFELDQVHVGQSIVNTAHKGQAENLVRVWGKHCALLYLDRVSTGTDIATFGFTAQWGNRIAGAERDTNIGMRGGQRVRVGESVDEIIAANELGYYLQNVVA